MFNQPDVGVSRIIIPTIHDENFSAKAVLRMHNCQELFLQHGAFVPACTSRIFLQIPPSIAS
jgi:hypothetical protein